MQQAPLVYEAFEMMATGLYAQREVLRSLQAKNFKIGKSQLSLLLQNRLYAGKVLVKAFGDIPLQFVNGIHEPIISEELFFKVQDVLFGRNLKKNQRKTKQLDGNFPLRGFLQCSCCGGKMSASKSKGNGGTYYYYHCNDCNKRYKTDVLNMQLESMLDGIKFDSEAKKLYMEVIKDCLKGSDSERKFEIKKKETEIDTNNKRLESLLDEKMDRNISQLDYESGKKRYEKNINTLLLEITDLKSIKTEFEAYLNWGFCMLQNVQKYYSISPISVKQKIIGSIYPEFMQIEDGEIKTTKVNEMVSLLSTINGTFGQKKTGQHLDKKELSRLVPGIGLEPIRPQWTQDFKSCVSTNSTTWAFFLGSQKKSSSYSEKVFSWSERRGSNPRPRPWQGRALPTELLSLEFRTAKVSKFLNRQNYFCKIVKLMLINIIFFN